MRWEERARMPAFPAFIRKIKIKGFLFERKYVILRPDTVY